MHSSQGENINFSQKNILYNSDDTDIIKIMSRKLIKIKNNKKILK